MDVAEALNFGGPISEGRFAQIGYRLAGVGRFTLQITCQLEPTNRKHANGLLGEVNFASLFRQPESLDQCPTGHRELKKIRRRVGNKRFMRKL
jgi:hypothetical protein